MLSTVCLHRWCVPRVRGLSPTLGEVEDAGRRFRAVCSRVADVCRVGDRAGERGTPGRRHMQVNRWRTPGRCGQDVPPGIKRVAVQPLPPGEELHGQPTPAGSAAAAAWRRARPACHHTRVGFSERNAPTALPTSAPESKHCPAWATRVGSCTSGSSGPRAMFELVQGSVGPKWCDGLSPPVRYSWRDRGRRP